MSNPPAESAYSDPEEVRDYGAEARQAAEGDPRYRHLVEIAQSSTRHVDVLMGMIETERKRGDYILTLLGMSALQVAELEKQIHDLQHQLSDAERRTYIDAKTGLLSEYAYNERLAALDRSIVASQSGGEHRTRPFEFTMVFLDFDGLGTVNYIVTEPVADRLLAKLGALLRETVRGEDQAYRWGGDEGAIIMPGVSVQNPEDQKALAARIDAAGKAALLEFAQELEDEGKSDEALKLRSMLVSGYSVGMAHYQPEIHADAASVAREAAVAMKRDKAERRRAAGLKLTDKNVLPVNLR